MDHAVCHMLTEFPLLVYLTVTTNAFFKHTLGLQGIHFQLVVNFVAHWSGSFF